MFDKPIFSRNQLNAIIAICAVAIVLLSTAGKEPELPEIQSFKLADTAIYVVETNSPNNRLRLSFALPASLQYDDLWGKLSQQQVLGKLQQLQKNLEYRNAQLALLMKPDHITIELAWLEEDALAPILAPLIQQLQTPVDETRWQRQADKIKAHHYLEQQQTDAADQLMNSWLHPEQQKKTFEYAYWRSFNTQLFSRSQLRISALVGDVGSVKADIETGLKSLPASYPWDNPIQPAITPQTQILSGYDNYRILLGTVLPGRQTELFPQHQMAIRIIELSAKQLGIASHWQPQALNSTLQLSAFSANPIKAKRLLSTLKQHIEAMDDDELEAERDNLIKRLHQQTADLDVLMEQLETIAFYDLSTNYLSNVVSQLESMSSENLSQAALDFLDADQFHWIIEQPSG